MTKDELERIKQAYYSGLDIQIWFSGYWEDFDIRDYSMFPEPFSENRQYRIVGSSYADIAEKRIAELENKVAILTNENKILKQGKTNVFAELNEETAESNAMLMNKVSDLEQENKELKDKLNNLASVAAVRLANWQKYEKENAELKKGLSVVNASNSFNKEQLTKAKELLNEFMRISKASDEDFEHDYSELIAEAEQFLKEV